MSEGKVREIVSWITVNGNHVPVFEGETSEDAVKRFTKVVEADVKKEAQISQNKTQADKLNKEDSSDKLPRRLYLNDISAEDANKGSDILNLRTKQRYSFKANTKLTQVHVFAGKGCSKEFRDADKYAKRYGGKTEDWQHCSGIGYITNGSETLKVETHWVQGKDGKIREAFIKEIL